MKEAYAGKVVHHVCRDSTMVVAREKVAAKEDKKVEKPKKKRGRLPKNAVKHQKNRQNWKNRYSKMLIC